MLDVSLAPALLRAQRRPGRRAGAMYPLHAASRHLHSLQRHVSRQLAAAAAALPRAARQEQQPDALAAAQAALRAAAALLAALLLHVSGGAAGVAHASVAEDKLLELVRQVEVKVDSAVGAVKDAASQGAADGPSAAAARGLVEEVCEVVEANFSDARNAGHDRQAWLALKERVLARPLRDTGAAHTAIRELLAALRDPYTRFVPPADFAAMAKYDVSGVGLNLGTAEEFGNKTGLALPAGRAPASEAAAEGVWVLGLIRGSPADAAGLQQGDQLLELDGRRLGGESPFAVASLLSGQEGEAAAGLGLEAAPVQLKVRRFDGSEQRVTLRRPVRALPSPVVARLEGSGGEARGIIKLTSFNARAQRDVLAAVRRLEAQGAARLVLDLRDNRGGLVSEGIEVARLFLSGDATVVRTEGRARSSAAPITAPGPAATAAPLVVLVNDHTASASEILAGALQDNCRAVLAGGRTYGKGLIQARRGARAAPWPRPHRRARRPASLAPCRPCIRRPCIRCPADAAQSVYELSDGSGLVLTVGKYVTPDGTDIDREGLAPDFRAPPGADAADAAIQACRLRRGLAPPPPAAEPAPAAAGAALPPPTL